VCARSLLVSANFPGRLAPRTFHERADLDALLMHTGGERGDLCARYATRNCRNLSRGERGGGAARVPVRGTKRLRAQGHRILICPRFALLIRQRCMLMPAITPCVYYTFRCRRPTYRDLRGGDREAGCRLRRGEPRVTLRAAPRTRDPIRNLYIFSD